MRESDGWARKNRKTSPAVPSSVRNDVFVSAFFHCLAIYLLSLREQIFLFLNMSDEKLWEMYFCGLIIYYIGESFFLRIHHHLACQAKKETRLIQYMEGSRLETNTAGKKPFIDFFAKFNFPNAAVMALKKGGKLFSQPLRFGPGIEFFQDGISLLLPPPCLHALVNYGSSFHLLEFLTVLHPDFPYKEENYSRFRSLLKTGIRGK